MLSKICKSLLYGLKIGIGVLSITAVLAFLSAPTIFGAAIITSSVVMAVLFWSLLSFVSAAIWRFIRAKAEPKQDFN